ncbi:MAG TPA: PilZ domain-containing protein [Polyangia bacterium]|nr:PilZ domain-containing protein [Polyangia bacterium]
MRDTMNMALEPAQARRVAPRVPYDEAIAIARFDGRGRLYARALDISATGIHVICADSCPLGTVVRCTLLLPGGPRNVRGRVVRETVLARGVGLAIAFSNVDPGTAAAIGSYIESRAHQVMPAKLRVEGVDKALRCEGMIDERTVRLTATLPFLRIDGGVDVVLGEHGQLAQRGVIKKIAVDPSTSDGIPRLAVDVVLGDTQPYGANRRHTGDLQPPPTKLPPACGHPLPSVLVSPGLVRDVRKVEERPPRRRVHFTAEIARRPDLAWAAPPAIVSRPIKHVRSRKPQRPTVRMGVVSSGLRDLRAWLTRRSRSIGVLLVIVPAMLAVAALLAN